MPEFKDVTDEITKTARDAAYVVVGLGVLGLQRAQVRRQELQKRLFEPRTQIQGHLGDVRGQLAAWLHPEADRPAVVLELGDLHHLR